MVQKHSAGKLKPSLASNPQTDDEQNEMITSESLSEPEHQSSQDDSSKCSKIMEDKGQRRALREQLEELREEIDDCQRLSESVMGESTQLPKMIRDLEFELSAVRGAFQHVWGELLETQSQLYLAQREIDRLRGLLRMNGPHSMLLVDLNSGSGGHTAMIPVGERGDHGALNFRHEHDPDGDSDVSDDY
ncbi:hypothetical protein SCUP234_09638 [Seiridium cupressi]